MECSESGVCLKCIEPLELIQIPVVKGLSDPQFKRTICGKWPSLHKGRSALDKSLFFPQQRKHKGQGADCPISCLPFWVYVSLYVTLNTRLL